MKQKSDDQTPVTEAVFKEELKSYPTKVDLQLALSNYPTKGDLEQALSNYPTKIDMRLEINQLERRVDTKARVYRDEILTKMDQIIGDLAQMREDREFERYDKRKLEEKVDDQEDRIVAIETKKTKTQH